GGSDSLMQAAVLQLYDPDRSKNPLIKNRASSWSAQLDSLKKFIQARGGPGNLRIRLLTRTLTSPTIPPQLQQLKALYPSLTHHVDDIPGNANARAGQQLAFGRRVTPVYDFSKAARILSLDANFLFSPEEPGALRYAREFARARRLPRSLPSG